MELIKKTMNVEDAKGWYLLQNEYRYFTEEFIDEDTGDPVTKECSEAVCRKGAQLTEITISLLEENGVKSVKVSNIPLLGNQEKSLDLFETILKQKTPKGDSKKTYHVTADSPAAAEKFIAEYLEINVEGSFEITKVNKLDYGRVIKIYDLEREQLEADKKRVKWYKCQIYSMIDDDAEEGNGKNAGNKNILAQAVSFENAITAIKLVLNRNEYESIYNTIKLLQELNIADVFIHDESVSYYSNEEL